MKVTLVESQKSSKGRSVSDRNKRFNIYLDGKFAFGADEDLIVNYRLVPGKEIKDLNKLLFEAEVGKLMERMYGLFSIRDRSEKEVRDYLKRLSFKRKVKDQDAISELVAEILIERLKQKGLINDLEFAKAWIEARRKSKFKGNTALKSELFAKGIDREIIDQVLENSGSGDQENLAAQALEKKIKSFENLPSLEFKKKATDFLLRHGFTYSICKKVVDKFANLD